MALFIAPFSSLSSSAAVEKRESSEHVQSTILSLRGFWEVNKKLPTRKHLSNWSCLCISLLNSTKLGANDLFVPSASTHPPPVRLRAGSAVQLAPPTKSIVEVRCLWKDFLCKKLLQEKCCKRKGLQLKACCIITIQSTPQHATCHFHGDPDAKIQSEVHICRTIAW